MNSNLMLFKELGIEKEKANQYSELTLSAEESALIRTLCLDLSFENNIYPQISKVFRENYDLEYNIKVVFLQYISFEKDLLTLLINTEIENDFFYLDIIIHSLKALNHNDDFYITKEEVNHLCDLMYSFPSNTNDFYVTLAEIIENIVNLSDELIVNYKQTPCRKLIPLIICLLHTNDNIKEFIISLTEQNYTNKLFIIRACEKIKKTERDFVISLIKDKLTELTTPEYNKYELLNPYLALLFALYIDDEDILIREEIKRIVNHFTDWDSEGLITVIYGSNPKMSPTIASLLFMIVNKLPNNKQSHIDYYIDNLFSQLSSYELKKYYLPIFSIISDDVGKELFNRLQENIDVYFEGLMNSILEADEYRVVALKLLKKLLNKDTVTIEMIDEQYYLYLIRCFHCLTIEADFICRIALDFYVNSTTTEIQENIYEYIVRVISENYFMVLKSLVSENDDTKLYSLDTYLNEKEELMKLAWNNPDFKPSIKRMEQYYEKLADQNAKIQEKAREASVFRDIFQSQTVLYGHKVRSYYQKDTGDFYIQENVMNKIEHNMPIPARFIFDPLFYKQELHSISKGFSND